MKPNLYICHTAYQVLVDLLRAGRCAGKPHTMVLSASVPDTAALAARLDATGRGQDCPWWTRRAGPDRDGAVCPPARRPAPLRSCAVGN